MRKRDLLASSLGNVLEWYDFGLFLFLAPIIGENFFPTGNAATSTLSALVVFATGFVCRPLGGILFGHFGDSHGRAQTLRVSIILISFTTLVVGLLPGYHTLGIASPILFTLLRLAQGISVGGEYSGIMIYLAETAPDKHRGFITSFAASGANLGFLFATLTILVIKNYLPTEIVSTWGWRIPFITLGCVGGLIFIYRIRLPETAVFRYISKLHDVQKTPLLSLFKSAPFALIKILGLTCMSATFYYVFFGFMPEYLNQYLGITSQVTLHIESIALLAMLFLVPLCGLCGDYIGRKNMLLMTAIAIIILVIPCFYLLQYKSSLAIIAALSIATIISSIDQGNSLTTVVESCPADVRYTGVAFAYNLGMAVFGGTAPLVVAWLTSHQSVIAPAYYLVFMALMSLCAIISLPQRNRPHLVNLLSK